jgi:hypothetical protein
MGNHRLVHVENPKNVNRQTRIFVPRDDLFNHDRWAETIIGRIIAPLVRGADYLHWFWFSRYDCPREMDSGDCDIDQIPKEFVNPENQHYRSVRFRYCVPKDRMNIFESECLKLISSANCVVSDFRDWDLVADLGAARFLDGETSDTRIRERAALVLENCYTIAKLILHALSGPDEEGRYHLPHHLNPDQRSAFNVIHHLFCNMTDVVLFMQFIEHIPGTALTPPQHVMHAIRARF